MSRGGSVGKAQLLNSFLSAARRRLDLPPGKKPTRGSAVCCRTAQDLSMALLSLL